MDGQSDIAVRVERDGQVRSLFLHELDHITMAELADMPPDLAASAADWFIESDRFVYDVDRKMFERRR